jgi:hypothetical protein
MSRRYLPCATRLIIFVTVDRVLYDVWDIVNVYVTPRTFASLFIISVRCPVRVSLRMIVTSSAITHTFRGTDPSVRPGSSLSSVMTRGFMNNM